MQTTRSMEEFSKLPEEVKSAICRKGYDATRYYHSREMMKDGTVYDCVHDGFRVFLIKDGAVFLDFDKNDGIYANYKDLHSWSLAFRKSTIETFNVYGRPA